MIYCIKLQKCLNGATEGNEKTEAASHFGGSGLDAPMRDQRPVVAGVGSEHALLAAPVNLHLERLLVCLFILIGRDTDT